MSVADLLGRASECSRLGQWDEAANLLEAVLRTQPDHPTALHLLGRIASRQGDHQRAERLIRRALGAGGSPSTMHHDLGMALLGQGRCDEAAAQFRIALGLDPALALALVGLGSALQRMGQLGEAISAFEHAVSIDPDHAAGHHKLGLARRAQGDLPRAIESLRQAVARDSLAVDPLSDLADALLAAGQAPAAVPLIREALERFPDSAQLHGLLGDAYQAQGSLADSIAPYERAVQLDRDLLAAWWGLGCAQAARGETAWAAAAFHRAVAIAPDFGIAFHNWGKALYELGQIDAAIDAFRRAAVLLQPNEHPLGMIATILPGSPTADDRAVCEARHAWAAQWSTRSHIPLTQARTGPARTRPERRRLRVGYVSSFFHHRNWMKPVWGLINHHDRGRFEIHLFSDVPEARVESGYRRHPHDHFHDISALDNLSAARRIADAQIDVLVDLNSYSKWARLPLFALRPAPIQVIWFGLYAPSGLACFDYLIVDPIALPPHSAGEAWIDEEIVRVTSSYLTFEVPYPVPDVVPPPCLSQRHMTFGCLAPQYKLTPQVLDTWTRILHACPGSRLVLKNVALGAQSNRLAVIDAFATRGIAADRLELQGPSEHFAFLTTYDCIDLALDTFPYNGGTTTMESLWQGVPVLTFSGARWISRISASLLHYAGLSEFIAADLEAHEAQVIALAQDGTTPDRLAQLRLGMRDRLRQAPVCDVEAFARQMEEAYLRMWESPRRVKRTGSEP